MNTFSFLVLYLCIFLSVIGKRQNKQTVKEDDTEKLLNLKESCCNSTDFDSFCIPEKCYFFLPVKKTWSAARTTCRKFYVEFPDLVDLANFNSTLEIKNILQITKLEEVLNSSIWISSSCCENEDYCINAKRTDQFITIIYGLRNNICRYRSMHVKDQKFQYEKENFMHYVLCELRIYRNITTDNETTTKNILNDVTTEFTDETEKENATFTDATITSETIISTNTTQTNYEITTTVITTIKTTSKTSRFCKEKKIKDVTWPNTIVGQNISKECPEGTIGKAYWYCNNDGIWEPEEPILDNCLSSWIHEINEEIAKNKDPIEIAENLANLSKKDLRWGDINGLVTTIQSLQTKLKTAFSDAHLLKFSDSLLKTGSNILNDNQKYGWKNIPEKKRIETASRFMQEMENIGKMISCSSTFNKDESIVKDNIALQSFIFRDDSQLIFPRSRDVMNTSTFISLPKNLPFKELLKCGQHMSGYGIIYKGISSYLTGDQKWKINSKTIGFSYANANDSISLPEGSDVEITLEHLQSGDFNTTCVFWNFKTLEWDGTNCSKIKSNTTHTKCACSHLTNFAVLMDISGHIEKTDNVIMTYLTYVCCSLSIISLIITIGCLMGFRAVRSRRSTITCNLCYCLLFVNLIVIFGLERTEIPVMCSVVAGILHYVAIASFVWMLLEGYHLYQMVIVVFHKIDTIKFRWLYLCGYGSPLLIVICSAAISPNSYGRKDFCWISYENGFTWSFAGPVAAIILANTVVLMMALRSASNVKMKKYQSKIRNILGWLKGSFSLMSLLGITWVFGFVYAEKSTLFFAYIFIIFNGLQGVFLMIFHVILNEKVRQCFKNIITRKKVSHHIFINSLRTTTSQNPLNSQMSVQPSKTSYLSSPRRLSVSPVSPSSTSHM